MNRVQEIINQLGVEGNFISQDKATIPYKRKGLELSEKGVRDLNEMTGYVKFQHKDESLDVEGMTKYIKEAYLQTTSCGTGILERVAQPRQPPASRSQRYKTV